MRSYGALTVFVTALALAAPAAALTVPDVIELARAGVPADVITAMIDADGTVFVLSPNQLIELRAAAVADEVIIKMLGTRRAERARRRAAVEEGSPELPLPSTIATRLGDTPGLVIIGADKPVRPTRAAAVFVPAYAMPFGIWGAPAAPRGAPAAPPPVVTSPDDTGFGRFMNNGWTSEGFGRFMNDGWRKPR